ncbi:MAG: DUF1501 domain-containing protein [Planctomycetaceae bacterium]|nr:DUF1501 domain-containing protein [Planctomycetaceae bacterium]
MISLHSTRSGRRGALLQIGSLAAGGMALSSRLQAAAESPAYIRDKAVILLFLHGGPSQIETFDPKMSAPAEIRSATGELMTSVPGTTFGGTFPGLAQRADKLTVVRSFTTGNGNHDIKPVVSRASMDASVGSIYARIAGTTDVNSGLPTNVALFPQSVDAERQPANMNFGRFDATGPLGNACAPFIPGSGGPFQESMTLSLAPDRLGDRRSLLSELDRLKSGADVGGTLDGVDRFRQQAFSTILNGAAEAFDLSQENSATVRAYDTEPLISPDRISRVWKNYNNYVDNVKTLGKLLLLSRRLVERGCGFVTATTNFVWDMHADVNNATMTEGMSYMGHPLDHALSAFIDDVESRGLQDRIMLVCCGEMGRTPRINAKGGRDHWGGLAPLLLYGGGVRRGAVIGQSTSDAGQPQTEPWTISNLLATVYHNVFDIGRLRLDQSLPVDLVRTVTSAVPIHGVLES